MTLGLFQWLFQKKENPTVTINPQELNRPLYVKDFRHIYYKLDDLTDYSLDFTFSLFSSLKKRSKTIHLFFEDFEVMYKENNRTYEIKITANNIGKKKNTLILFHKTFLDDGEEIVLSDYDDLRKFLLLQCVTIKKIHQTLFKRQTNEHVEQLKTEAIQNMKKLMN